MAGLGTYCVGGGPLLGGAVIGVLPNVKLVRWEEVDVRLLEALEDGPCNTQASSERREPTCAGRAPGCSPFFISRTSWSCCSSAGTSTSRPCFRMASTAVRPPLRRKLKSPNQNTSSNRVVTSAGHREKCIHTGLPICGPSDRCTDPRPSDGAPPPGCPPPRITAGQWLLGRGRGHQLVGVAEAVVKVFWLVQIWTAADNPEAT